MPKLNGQRHIPDHFADHNLNLRAFVDLPAKGESLEQEVLGVLDRLRTRTFSREEAKDAILRIIARETETFETAVKRALCPGQLYAEGVTADHED
jgi:hypothetical protein